MSQTKTKTKDIFPWALKRPSLPESTKDYTDPLQPGLVLPLTLRALDTLGLSQALNEAETKGEPFVATEEHDAALFPAPDGKPFPLTDDIIQNACMLHVAHVGPGTLYTFEDWIGWALMAPCLFSEAVREMTRLCRSLGNAPGAAADTGTGSASPSNTDSPTPK